jgi:arylsulfatase A-like enzyme/tetratricopeptide (TPR) repeat protein
MTTRKRNDEGPAARGAGKWGAAIAAAAMLAAAAGCGGRGERRFQRAPVILISIDTLRADHLPAYGYRQVKTPAMDALRRDSVLYENAYSHVPLTLPSHTTMMTGMLPPQNAVRDNVGYVLAPGHVTIASTLKENGYATGGAISAVVLTATTGINQGFDFFEDGVEAQTETASLAQVQRSGFDTEKIAEKWISEHEKTPFFFFLHLYEPHTPYKPIPPFDAEYRDRPYDGEIATVDQIVGKFTDYLRREGIYDRALLVLVSDHGEGLGEHGELEHGVLLYRETLHVPMMIKLPGKADAGQSVAVPVGLEDLFPTITQTVGIAPPANLAGKAVPFTASAARSFPVRDIYSETLYPRYHFGWSDLAALTNDRYEYIHAPKDEIYDVVGDPSETHDLASGLPAPFRRMRNALLAMDRPRQAPGHGDPEQVKKLAALGYLGSASPPEDAANLPNPMERVGELSLLHKAIRLYAEKSYAEAIPLLRELLRKEPGMTDAWTQLSNTFHKLGQTEQSLEALKQADRWKPGDPVTLASMANEYFDLGDFAQAKLFAQRSIAVSGPAEAHEVLAAVLMHDKDLDGAEKEAREALERGHMGHVKPAILLAQVSKARGDLSGALAQLDKVETELENREDRQVSNLHYFKGDLLARMGRNAEAEQEFRQEIKYFPGNPGGWSSLAFLLASEGRSGEARQTLLEMVKKSPTPRCFRAAGETFKILGDPAAAAFWKQRADAAARQAAAPPA